MRLAFKPFDGRFQRQHDVVDQESGTKVGSIYCDGVGFTSGGISGSGGMKISLFDGKYTLAANRREECWAFIKGVEAVLNHMTSLREAIPKDVISDAA
jgi:hypothetical protein